MKKYILKTEVMAEPMDEATAIGLGYARDHNEQRAPRDGYHVLYPDGYHSWCPKQQFEATNQLAETHIDRMVIEHKELREKMDKLRQFASTHECLRLGFAGQVELFRQYEAMKIYFHVLTLRLALERIETNKVSALSATKVDTVVPYPTDGPHKCACDPDDCRDCNENCNGCGPTDESA